jgi:uncharacterized membrane protein
MKDTLSDRSPSGATFRSSLGLPLDVLVAVGLVVSVDLLLVVDPVGHPGLRLLLGGLLLVVLPGYAAVAALLPGWLRPPATDQGAPRASALELVERGALSLGIGLAIVPLVALALTLAGRGLGLRPVATTLTGLVVAGLLVAVVRRRAAAPDRRFRLGVGDWLRAAWRALAAPGADRATTALNVLLAAAVVIATASLGVALAFPVDGERYTEFALRTPGEDGVPVADFPEELTAGTNASFVAVVENHEGERAAYTVVAQLQRVRDGPDGPVVVERRELARTNRTLGPGERWAYNHTVRPNATGTDLRLVYHLHRGDSTGEPYRRLSIWVDVVA